MSACCKRRGAACEEAAADDHPGCARNRAFAALLRRLGIKHDAIKPHCPRQNGEAERCNRTLKQWACRQARCDRQTRDQALIDRPRCYNRRRPRTSLGGNPPTSRLSTT